MKFVFSAKTKKGQTKSGEIEAPDRESAVRELQDRNLVIVTLERSARGGKEFNFMPISMIERVAFTKHLSIMLKAGVALDEALKIAELQVKGRLKSVLKDLRESVEAGERLADAMEKHPEVFSTYYINMVRAGEESGNLAENLDQLSVRFAKDYELRRKAQSAMLYPAIVITLTGALGALIALYILPRLSGLFKAFDFQLPRSTRLLLWLSNMFRDHGIWITLGIIGFIILFFLVVKSKFAKPLVDWLVLRLPFFRSVTIPLNTTRLTMVLGSLLKSGIPIDVALSVTEQVIGNIYYKKIIKQSQKRVAQGEPFSSSLHGNESLISPFVYRMVQIGDETGKTEDILFYVADFYENELDSTLKNLSTVIEPALLIVIGLVVVWVALAVITPVYNFIGTIG